MGIGKWLTGQPRSNVKTKKEIQLPVAAPVEDAAKDIVKLIRLRPCLQCSYGEAGLAEAIYHIHFKVGNAEKLNAKVISILETEHEISFYMKAVKPRIKRGGPFLA